jgi:hypothetical protein
MLWLLQLIISIHLKGRIFVRDTPVSVQATLAAELHLAEEPILYGEREEQNSEPW